jgi:hypothetical protein
MVFSSYYVAQLMLPQVFWKQAAKFPAQLEEQLDADISTPTAAMPGAAAITRVEARVDSLIEEVATVRQELREGLAGFASAAPESPTAESPKPQSDAPSNPAAITEELLAELDKRSEDRLEAVWRELKGYADASAVQAGQLERNLSTRMDKVEGYLNVLSNRGIGGDAADLKKERQSTDQRAKDIEWLNWRISWLEWATGGEKRGFGRPLDEKSTLPAPPPGTVTAQCFSQPLTEDMELWAREPGGRQRLRRRMTTPPPPSHTKKPTLTSDHVLQPLRLSKSHGRLP